MSTDRERMLAALQALNPYGRLPYLGEYADAALAVAHEMVAEAMEQVKRDVQAVLEGDG